MLILLVSVLGNTTILVASIKYKAFKLHGVIVTFIQHIAVNDLQITIALVFTQIINLLTNKRIFSSKLCYVRANHSPFCSSVSLFMVCGMTVSKYLLIKFPLRTRYWSRKQAQKLCACLWILSLSSPILSLAVDPMDVYWDSRLYTCFNAFSSHIWKLLLPVTVVILAFAPGIVTIGTSVLLVRHLLYARETARRIGARVPCRGIVTVLLTATVYSMSFLPISLYLAIHSSLRDEKVSAYLFRIGDTSKYFNVVANFFIYLFSVASFRGLLRDKVKMVKSSVYRTASDAISDRRSTFKLRQTETELI